MKKKKSRMTQAARRAVREYLKLATNSCYVHKISFGRGIVIKQLCGDCSAVEEREEDGTG